MTAEEQLIGSLIQYPSRLYELSIKPTDFMSPRCREAFEAINEVVGSGKPVDYVSVSTHGPDAVWLSMCGSEATPAVKDLAARVLEQSKRHRLKVLAREVIERADTDSVGDLIEHVDTTMTAINESTEDEVVSIGAEVMPMVEEFERRYRRKGEIPGISTGIPFLDSTILGFCPERYYVIGARPSDGKSALLLHFALQAANTVPVGFISIESSRAELLERAFQNIGGIGGYALRMGTLEKADFGRMASAGEVLRNKPIWIADRPNMTVADVKARARRMVRQHGIKILLLDYLQLVQMPGGLTDYERVSRVSVAMKELARELKIPLVTAAQLNRQAEQGKNHRPKLSELKNSGQIEQDADVAILIHRTAEETLLCVEKNRDGSRRVGPVTFDEARMRWVP